MTASNTAHVGVGLKLDCPAGNYVSFITGMGSPNLAYQVVTNAPDIHPPLPWPPVPGSDVYAERCPCVACCGRLVGDTVAAIMVEVDAQDHSTKVNEDTYQLRYLETARDSIVREAQLRGYGISRGFDHHHNADPTTETYLLASRRVSVRYANDFNGEVADVSVWLPVSTTGQPSYPGTVAGALEAVRAVPQVSRRP